MAHKQSKYSREFAIEQLKADLISALPPNAQISKVEFEGPFVVLYSLNPTVLMENGDIVKSLAKTLRKRIVIRSDVTVRREKEEASARIREIVPENAEITDIIFDDELLMKYNKIFSTEHIIVTKWMYFAVGFGIEAVIDLIKNKSLLGFELRKNN